MPDIAVRKAGAPTPAEWDPFQMMREMLRWDPFREMIPTFPDLNRMAGFNPAFEIKETKEGYVFSADLPGVAEKDLEIRVAGNRLTVSGKREAEEAKKDDTFYTYERTYGTFTRTFTLPEGADTEHIKADLRAGVLTLQVPKTPETLPKKIPLGTEKTKA